jgi:tetratricopeptide (TPR) repeat protein
LIRLVPDDARAYNNRGVAHGAKGERDEAIADFTKAIWLNPDYAGAYYGRSGQYDALRDYDKAVADCTEALRLKPDYAEAHSRRGVAYMRKGEHDKAIADQTEAIRLKPDDAEGYRGRGYTYNVMGDYDKAIADYREAVRIDPHSGSPHNDLAWMLATCSEERVRDGKQAVDNATRACELTKWKEWRALDTLAAACAEAGQFDKAAEFQQKALDMATKDEKAGCRERLSLYRDGKPYRDVKRK